MVKIKSLLVSSLTVFSMGLYASDPRPFTAGEGSIGTMLAYNESRKDEVARLTKDNKLLEGAVKALQAELDERNAELEACQKLLQAQEREHEKALEELLAKAKEMQKAQQYLDMQMRRLRRQ